jgi:hypothetical protein
MRTQHVILNYVLFQVGWFSCVLGAANNQPWLACLVVLAIVLGQVYYAPFPKQALKLILLACVLGSFVDQMLLNNHIVEYASNGWSVAIVPVWIIGLWMSFSSTLNVSMRWLRNQKVTAFLFGLIGGPLAYVAAEKLGAIHIPPMLLNYVILGLFWGFAMLALIEFSQQFDGYANA